MAYAWKYTSKLNSLVFLFTIQWVLNVLWNPIFFRYHFVLAGLIVITMLTILVAYFFFGYMAELKVKVLYVLPYLLWLIIATSLNFYVYVNN
jgi:tryptophan-rich sensory protein